jgi:hypothetical protein
MRVGQTTQKIALNVLLIIEICVILNGSILTRKTLIHSILTKEVKDMKNDA